MATALVDGWLRWTAVSLVAAALDCGFVGRLVDCGRRLEPLWKGTYGGAWAGSLLKRAAGRSVSLCARL